MVYWNWRQKLSQGRKENPMDGSMFLLLGGGLLIIIIAVVISVVSSVVSAIAADQDETED